MNSAASHELFTKITTSLLKSKWLKINSISEAYINNAIEDIKFINKIEEMLLKKDFSCKNVLDLCINMMMGLVDELIPDNWLIYIYNYALNKSYPHAVEIRLYDYLSPACELYLNVLGTVSEYEKHSSDSTWQGKYPLKFLTVTEEDRLENSLEYKNFISAFKKDNIYEMMKLHQEITGYNTLDHICGVHFLSLYIARQLSYAGMNVDLGRVSGAAAGHDIGKYGCSKSELKRVPYLHYYYTDYWFKKHDIAYIGHVAVNHSTWDLELENLPLESLILIYSDFRVKNKTDKNNTYEMHIFELEESFSVILHKLDNVDSKKEDRYKRVYAKLKDFENYLVHIGINIDINSKNINYINNINFNENYSLMQGKEIIDNFKHLSLGHNINLMYRLRDEYSLNSILEQARSQKDWQRLREYLQIFGEYSTYLTQKQKLIMIKFLYDQLTHREDDIRRQCSELIGSLIAIFDEDYSKEVPENAILEPPEITSVELFNKYIDLYLHPDHKIIPSHRSWIGYSLSIMISSLFANCRKDQVPEYIGILLKHYNLDQIESETHLFLLEGAKYIPGIENEKCLNDFWGYLWEILSESNEILRLSSLEVIYFHIGRIKKSHPFVKKFEDLFIKKGTVPLSPQENYLYLKISELLNMKNNFKEPYVKYFNENRNMISDFYLSNLKSATHHIVKRIQIEMLFNKANNNVDNTALYTAMHYCNLLKVSAVEGVRNCAGEALIKLIPVLTMEQRNDVAVELLRALEIEGYQFAKYIPNYLGRVMLFLKPVELDELIDDFVDKIKQSSPIINSLLLKTIGITIVNYPKYNDIFKEEISNHNRRLEKMLGILLNGLVNYNIEVKQVALSVIGKDIFGATTLSLIEKNKIFGLISKKILTLLTYNPIDELLFFINSIVLNHIYKFIADYSFFIGSIKLEFPKRAAFFPGTFDPFSLSHKEIAKVIRDMDFEVYLAVDEFSWSKQTIPTSLRRNIINMSVADELNIFLYPMDTPTNIANPVDLKLLRDSFPNSKLYMVAGSDVIINASSYHGDRCENSIHTFPHIIFDRRTLNYSNEHDELLNEGFKKIEGDVIRLALPTQYEDISSTQIRNYIDENRDVTSLVDPLAQKYIYEHSFYRREPQYKTLIEPISIDIEIIENITSDILEKVMLLFNKNLLNTYSRLKEFSTKNNARIILVKDSRQDGKILGFSTFHWVRSNAIYSDFQNSFVSEYIRENGIGRIILIDGIFIDRTSSLENLEQIILTETLAFCLAKDYDYAVFQNIVGSYYSDSLYKLLELNGFIPLPFEKEKNKVYVVNMNSPCTLNLDVKAMIKEPYKNSAIVNKAIVNSRKRLQMALTKLYPGNLVLSFDITMLQDTLIKKICAENGVSQIQTKPRILGPYICVPFGNILKRNIIPNTITKALHTEKLFSPDMKSSRIGSLLHYMDLETQLKMIHSFNRPIILVDDLLHNGYRAKAIYPLLKKENIKVNKTIVGILSGKGKELMDMQNVEVDSAYFIPKLKAWFNESLQYPFIGGDTLWRGVPPEKYLIPSINLILPYTSPTFLKNTSKSSIYEFSKVSIENSYEILKALEKEYEAVHERSLTLASLGDVFILPRYPDRGSDITYDYNLNPSHYLENDMEQLGRMEEIINMI